jgi:hypothetical protein
MVFHTPINSTTTTTPTSFDKDFQLFHSNPDPTPPPKPSGIDPTHPESHNLPSLANMPKLELPSPRVSKAPDSKKNSLVAGDSSDAAAERAKIVWPNAAARHAGFRDLVVFLRYYNLKVTEKGDIERGREMLRGFGYGV